MTAMEKLLARSRAVGVQGDRVLWWTDGGLEFSTSLEVAVEYGVEKRRLL